MAESIQSSIAAVARRLEEYAAREIDATIDSRDDMLADGSAEALADYRRVGRSAIENVAHALALAGLAKVESVLDMACGYGRVLRHLVAFFPEARIVACDLDPERVAFCTRTFGVEGVISREDPGELAFDRRFDLVWCGSLLTHLPWMPFVRTLQLFARSLAERGVAVVSLHGRFAAIHQERRWRYLAPERFEAIQADLRRSGFGYADYEAPAAPRGARRYGISVALPSHVARIVEGLPDVRLLGYRERAWDDHHDVLVFGRPAVHAPDAG